MVRSPFDLARRENAAALVFRDSRTGDTGTIAQRDEDGLFVFYPHVQQHPPTLVLEPGRFARVREESGKEPAEAV